MRKVLFILGELADGDIDWMISAGRRTRFDGGEVMIRQGVPIDSLFIILDGHCSVSVEVDDAAPTELARVGAGEILGEMSLIESAPPSATVTPVDDTLTLAIPMDRLVRKLDEDQGFAARFYRALAVFLSHRLRNTVGQVAPGGEGRVRPGSDDGSADDELDMGVLDKVSMAGARFEKILRKMRGG